MALLAQEQGPEENFRSLNISGGDEAANQLDGVAINNMDIGLRKDVHLREQMKLQFRVEFINALNHPLFPAPAVNPGAAKFGQVSASNQNNYARRAQLMAKFIF